MADTINYDDMSDEDFMEALEIAGSEPKEEEENDNIEDTNQEEDSTETEEDDTDTEHQDDETDADTEDETDEDEEDETEGNTQIENSSDEDEDETEDEDADTSTEENETETESDESETNENPAEGGKETDEINYEEQYKALLSDNGKLKQFENFYNEVTSEFTANGKKVKGFTDPKKVIESQQMAAGFSDKMSSFTPYKKFMNTIKDKGFLQDPEKFNLAMQLLDGDQEALKKHIKDLEIDPFEMDMENINYTSKNQVSSDLEVAYSDIMENAKVHNVDSQVQSVINKDWDDKSVIALLEDPQSSADLVNHISSGAYKVVQERIAEKKRTDVHNVYSSKTMIEQYREAAREIEADYSAYQESQNQENVENSSNQEIDEDKIQAEIARIETERKEETYRAKAAQKNAKADEARKKATSISKKKPRAKKKTKVFDPSTANDEQFTQYLDSLLYS